MSSSTADVPDRRLFVSCTGCGWQASAYSRDEVARLHAEHVAGVAGSGMAAILSRAAAEGQGTLW
ncbi:hypothetical protein CBR64_20845 [Cellulosimicrobium cellulans]|uniref:Uncharacterized protein n=1 Tax=Cellulosimicrobium cellulans TaxID=1710 RepID=A0A1Y0HZ75_CELCE|nr:hypothetical protein [Cellulosimicrobium cellulans]ARU53508.1 hypothetical protein CBR64_20845 [Cellulosimicrobium cellulans]